MQHLEARALRRVAVFAGLVGAALLTIPEAHTAVAVGATAALMLRIVLGVAGGLAPVAPRRPEPRRLAHA